MLVEQHTSFSRHNLMLQNLLQSCSNLIYTEQVNQSDLVFHVLALRIAQPCTHVVVSASMFCATCTPIYRLLTPMTMAMQSHQDHPLQT